MKLLESEKGRTISQWVLNGTAFCIKNMSTFSSLVQEEIGTRRASFQSYLQGFGFKAVPGYPNTWKHERFLRDRPSLAKSIFDDSGIPSAPPPPPPPPPPKTTTRLPRTQKDFLEHFPARLMGLLSDPSNASAIAWRADGLAFTIVNKDIFCSQLLPQKAENVKYSRFISELPQWNFMSLEHQGTPLTWYHPFFRRDRPDLSYQIKMSRSRSGRTSRGSIAPGRQPSVGSENFPAIVRSLLANDQFSHLLAWNSHGLSFTIKEKGGFEQEMCGGNSFFGLGYQAFDGKLRDWGFNLVAQDEDFDVWHHKYFQRDRPDLSSRIQRGVSTSAAANPLTPTLTAEATNDAYYPSSANADADASTHQEYPLTFLQKLRAVLDDKSNNDIAYWNAEGIALTLVFGNERFQQKVLGQVFGGLTFDMLSAELISYGFEMTSNDPGKSSRWQCELFQRRDPEDDDEGIFDVRAEEALGLEDHFPRPERVSGEEEKKEDDVRPRRTRVVHPAAKALLKSSAGEPFPDSIMRKKISPRTSTKTQAGPSSAATASKYRSSKRGSSRPPPPPPPPPLPTTSSLTNKKRKIGSVSKPIRKPDPPPKPLSISATVSGAYHPGGGQKKKQYSPRSPRRYGGKIITSPVAKSMVPAGVPRGITIRPSGKWQAQFYYFGKSRYAGVFDTADEAVIAYEVLRKELKQSKVVAGDHDALFDAARKKAVEAASKVKSKVAASGKEPMPALKVAAAPSEANEGDAPGSEGELIEEVSNDGLPSEAETAKRARTNSQSLEATAVANPQIHVEACEMRNETETVEKHPSEPTPTLYVARDSGQAFNKKDAPNSKSSNGTGGSSERSTVIGGDWLAIFAAAAMFISDDVMTGSLFPIRPTATPSRVSDWEPIIFSDKDLFMKHIEELYRAIEIHMNRVKDSAQLRAISIPSTLPKTFLERFRRYGYKKEDGGKHSPHFYKKTGYFHIAPDAEKTKIIYDAIKAIGYQPKQILELIDVPSSPANKSQDKAPSGSGAVKGDSKGAATTKAAIAIMHVASGIKRPKGRCAVVDCPKYRQGK